MLKRPIWTVTLAAGLAIVLAACGPRKIALTAELSSFKFTPSTLEVPPNAEVTLTLTNNTSVVHQWVVMKLGAQAALPWSPRP